MTGEVDGQAADLTALFERSKQRYDELVASRQDDAGFRHHFDKFRSVEPTSTQQGHDYVMSFIISLEGWRKGRYDTALLLQDCEEFAAIASAWRLDFFLEAARIGETDTLREMDGLLRKTLTRRKVIELAKAMRPRLEALMAAEGLNPPREKRGATTAAAVAEIHPDRSLDRHDTTWGKISSPHVSTM